MAWMMAGMPGNTAPPPPPGEPQPSPPARPGHAPQQQPGPQMCALWHHRGSARIKAQRPPRPPAGPHPALTQPSTHHTDRVPPTPHQRRALRHDQGLARHRAPDKNVHPNGQPNDINHNRTQPQRSASTGHHLLGGEPCPAHEYGGNPLAPYTRKRAQARAPEGTWLHNSKTPPDASTRGRQPAACQAVATQAQQGPRLHHSPAIRPTEGPTHAPSAAPSHTDMCRHQRPAPRHRTPPHPQPHREPLSPSSGDTQHIGPGVPSAGPGTSRAGVPTAPRPTSQAGSTAHRNAI